MNPYRSSDITNFFIAGINYKKADVSTRTHFAVNDGRYRQLLNLAPSCGINSMFILSTCNRTEIYGFANDAGQLIELLCPQSENSRQVFQNLAYVKRGEEAVRHLFEVGAGLDSQILGDYEIIGQLKHAVKTAKEHDLLNCTLERLVNTVLQASKEIKNNTALSSGVVSVSFAAVQYIKENTAPGDDEKILVIGTGKLGRNTCKNLVSYLGTKNITLLNRTTGKAEELAKELSLKYAPITDLAEQVAASTIILVSTSACEPVITKALVENKGDKLIIDLSVPYNVASEVNALKNITLVNVDEISKTKDDTLQKREGELPKAKRIIDQHMGRFMEWCQMRQHARALSAVKTKLTELYAHHLLTPANDQPVFQKDNADKKIQRVVKGMAGKMGAQDQRGCQFIEAINEFIVAVSG